MFVAQAALSAAQVMRGMAAADTLHTSVLAALERNGSARLLTPRQYSVNGSVHV
jgi:hypothetical protein